MLLAMKNLNINDQETSHLNTPLHLAIMTNKLEIVKILFNYPNIDINIKNTKNYTPFHAAMNLQFLIEAKGKEIELNDRFEIIKLFLYSKKKFDVLSSNGVNLFFFFSKMLTLQRDNPFNTFFHYFYLLDSKSREKAASILQFIVENIKEDNCKQQILNFFFDFFIEYSISNCNAKPDSKKNSECKTIQIEKIVNYLRPKIIFHISL